MLVGENGCGKTAVLEAIRLATNPRIPPASIVEQDFHSADAGDVSITVHFDNLFLATVEDGYANHRVPCDGVKLEIKRRSSATKGRVLSDPFVVTQCCLPIPYSSRAEIDPGRIPAGVDASSLPLAVEVDAEAVHIARRTGSGTRDLRRGALTLSLDLIGYPSVFLFDRRREREAKHGFSTLLTRIARELNWRYRRKWDPAATQTAWDTYYDLTVGVVQDRKGKRVLEPLRNRLSALMKRDYSALELSLLPLEEPFGNSFLALREGLNQIDLDGLGSGEAVILAYALLEHMSRLAREELVFLIDEPEMHLHPQVQRRLVVDFEASAHQVIVSSHSPLFASFALWRGITRMHEGQQHPTPAALSQVHAGQTVEQHLDEIAHWRQERTVFSDTDAELLFAPAVVLVEGPVDRYGLQSFAAKLGLDWSGLTVVSCGGKPRVPYYALIADAFGIPAFAVFDLDEKPVSDGENERVTSRLFGCPHATFAVSFEDIIGAPRRSPHKASEAIRMIDEMDGTGIPQPVREVIGTIEEWRVSQGLP